MRKFNNWMFVAALALFILPSCDYFSLDDPQPVNEVTPENSITDRQSARTAESDR